MIKSGRDGQVMWDETGVIPGTPTVIASLNNWKLSLKTDKIEVTCFGDQNKVYVPGMKDISGSVAGFWNSTDTTLVDAADATTPGTLKLVPHSTEATHFWHGLAYMDADIDTSVDGAPAISGTFMAAGPWVRMPNTALLMPQGTVPPGVPPGYQPPPGYVLTPAPGQVAA